jgi:hypothetical protein
MNSLAKQLLTFSGSGIRKAATGIRVLEMVALFGFLVLATIGWSYHGTGRPWQIYAAADCLVLTCFVAECLFWIVRKLGAMSGYQSERSPRPFSRHRANRI